MIAIDEILSVAPRTAGSFEYPQSGFFRFYISDVVVDVREYPFDPLQDEVVLVLIDRHELQGQAAIGGCLVLPDEAVTVKPADKRGFIRKARVSRVQLPHLAGSGKPQPHSRRQLVHRHPFCFTRGVSRDASTK